MLHGACAPDMRSSNGAVAKSMSLLPGVVEWTWFLACFLFDMFYVSEVHTNEALAGLIILGKLERGRVMFCLRWRFDWLLLLLLLTWMLMFHSMQRPGVLRAQLSGCECCWIACALNEKVRAHHLPHLRLH